MTDHATIADVLERAADIMFVRGRTQGTIMDADGRVCPNGAIMIAAGIIAEDHRCEGGYDECDSTHNFAYDGSPIEWANEWVTCHDDLVPGASSLWRLNDAYRRSVISTSPLRVRDDGPCLSDADMVDLLRRMAKDAREQET